MSSETSIWIKNHSDVIDHAVLNILLESESDEMIDWGEGELVVTRVGYWLDLLVSGLDVREHLYLLLRELKRVAARMEKDFFAPTEAVGDANLDIRAWSERWIRDSRTWCVEHDDVIDMRLANALFRASVVQEYEFKWVDGEYKQVELPERRFAHMLKLPRSMNYLPSFYDALPLIASGDMEIRNIGKKSRQLIASVLNGRSPNRMNNE